MNAQIDEKKRKIDEARQTYSSFNFLFSRTQTKKLNKGKKIDNKNKVYPFILLIKSTLIVPDLLKKIIKMANPIAASAAATTSINNAKI